MARPSSPGGLSGVRHLQIWWRPGSRRRRRGGMAGRSGRGCGRRSSSGRIRSRPTRASGSRSLADDVALGPLPGLLDREQGGQQPLARPDPAAGGRRPAPLPLGGRARGSETVFSPYQDTIVRPNLPDRTESAEIRRGRSRRAGRQPDDDGAGRRPGLDLRHLLPDRRPALRRPPRRRGTCRRAARTSARSSAAWRSAGGSTGSPSGSPGRRSSTTRGRPTC